LAIEAAAWAVLYVWLGALPAWAPAMLYSLEAITSFGHADVHNFAPTIGLRVDF
jgi:hypothetical protein